MKPTFKFAAAIFIECIFILSACKKNNSEVEPIPTTGDEPLTAEEDSFLSSLPDTLIRLEDIILEDGQNVRSFLETNDPGFLLNYPSGKKSNTTALTPRLQKETFVARMFAMGNHLVDHPRHTYPAAGNDSPAQTKLAYSWGSKDYDKRQKPPRVETDGCNSLKIYGLDCTGMLYNMTKTANLGLPPTAFWVENISNTKIWTDAFKASADYKDLKMKDMTHIPESEMKNGDIILWARHVGVYLYGKIYQSNGASQKPGCNNNLAADKGPRMIDFGEMLRWRQSMNNYKVFRAVYGQDYTLTIADDFTGVHTGAPTLCKLGDYIDSTIINITVTAKDSVILNYINNSTPAITHSSDACTCLSMHFINGSAIEYSDFNGTVSGYNLTWGITATYCMSTDVLECPPDPPQTFPGQVFPGNPVSGGNIALPQYPVVSVVYPFGGNSTLTVTRVE